MLGVWDDADAKKKKEQNYMQIRTFKNLNFQQENWLKVDIFYCEAGQWLNHYCISEQSPEILKSQTLKRNIFSNL